jgi:hypothetical protein
MRITTMLIAAAALLAGCSTTQERAAAAQADVERMMQIYGPACTRLGYAAESDQWRNCVLHLSEADDIQRYGYPSYYAGGARYWGHGRWGPYW